MGRHSRMTSTEHSRPANTSSRAFSDRSPRLRSGRAIRQCVEPGRPVPAGPGYVIANAAVDRVHDESEPRKPRRRRECEATAGRTLRPARVQLFEVALHHDDPHELIWVAYAADGIRTAAAFRVGDLSLVVLLEEHELRGPAGCGAEGAGVFSRSRSEEHTSELQSH